MLKCRSVLKTLSRNKHAKTHWSMVEKKIYPKDRALQNFDDFYGNVYGNRWKSMRIALLCQHKYIALVNNFGDSDKTVNSLEADGAINLKAIYDIGKENLESSNKGLYANDNITNVDNKIDRIIDSKRNSEVESLFSDQTRMESVPDQLKTNDETSNKDLLQAISDYKKPLEQVLQEDSDIDYRRIIDPAHGTSGLYEFVPATKIKGMEDWVFESDHYRYYSNTMDFPLKIEMELDFQFPSSLQLFTYEKGNVSDFRSPKKTDTGVLSHFLMDGSSVLPPLALNLQPGDRVLDACAAPGGKSLLMLQTLYPKLVVCNDIQESRVNRIRKIMDQYIYDFGENVDKHRCIITCQDARTISEYGEYDKILVDVPCTTDRHVVKENDNNIFKPTRVKERLRIPELQAGILTNSIRLLRPGGSLVYSTCSLSPVQNDGVVHMALANVFKEHGITVTIKDLSLAMQPFDCIFKFENPKGLKYGQLVTPFLPANFGPMYFCKITRN
ncbi:unnamed protein product [Diamesa serratosioi]